MGKDNLKDIITNNERAKTRITIRKIMHDVKTNYGKNCVNPYCMYCK